MIIVELSQRFGISIITPRYKS